MRGFLSSPYGRSLSGMLLELAMMIIYRDLVLCVTNVKRSDTALIPLPLAAPIWSAQERALYEH